jgi:stage V sporulation protein K
MEDKQHDFVLILAGYPREMDNFLSLNPGLLSRFPLVVDFPDYSVEDLIEIANRMMSEREYRFNDEAAAKLKEHLMAVKVMTHPSKFSNGRYVRNIIEKSIRSQAMRLLLTDRYNREDLLTIKGQDLDLSDEKK